MKKRMFVILLAAAAAGAGLLHLRGGADGDAPPARMIATENPAVAGNPAPGATWGRDVLRAPPRTAESPTQPELPRYVVKLATLRELPEPPLEVPLPTR